MLGPDTFSRREPYSRLFAHRGLLASGTKVLSGSVAFFREDAPIGRCFNRETDSGAPGRHELGETVEAGELDFFAEAAREDGHP